MLNLHRALFCTGIDLDDIMQNDCLAYKYFVFNRFSLVGYNIWYCVVCDYRGTPKFSPICIYQESECLYMIIFRIICEFMRGSSILCRAGGGGGGWGRSRPYCQKTALTTFF